MSKKLLIRSLGAGYRNIVKPILFTESPETVHNRITAIGERYGRGGVAKTLAEKLLLTNYPQLAQTIAGIKFTKPIGLSAGFDYEARLTQMLPALDFGFHTVGTITNQPCRGNPSPQLGRLPKSKSLLVNKGFKNPGAKIVSRKLSQFQFAIPLGVSIGRTNTTALKNEAESIDDIVSAFQAFESSRVRHAYYELNISCPNLVGNISFYPPENLRALLSAVTALNISRPIFIKMPIEKSGKEVRDMLEVITNFPIAGVIFGNLQKNRKDPSFDPAEIAVAGKGNFSGKPTRNRSNELISLTHKHYGDRLTIIGTGGVFTAEDAYEKILRGASLVQMITGLIYRGPQVVSEIHHGLARLLAEDGYSHISEAIGQGHAA